MAINVRTNSMGLCLTCNNSPNCAYRKLRGFDAMFCEMFDDHVTPREAAYGGSNPGPLRSAPRPEPEAPVVGLCSNCEHRHECAYPKPEGGVWHCEEYR